MLSQSLLFGALSRKTTSNTQNATPWSNWTGLNARSLSTAAATEPEEAAASKKPSPAQQIHTNALRKEMGPIASSRRANRLQGNFKLLLGVMAVFTGIYYYSVWKVGQDDFSDVDELGNVREKV